MIVCVSSYHHFSFLGVGDTSSIVVVVVVVVMALLAHVEVDVEVNPREPRPEADQRPTQALTLALEHNKCPIIIIITRAY
jgi:hypothetical protein